MSSKCGGWKLGACAVAAMVAAACGGKSNSGDANNTGGTGGGGGSGGSGAQTTGGAPNGGTGGNAPGTGGSATGGASVGTGGAPPAACDRAPCEGITLLGQTWPACCLSATQCGVDLMGNCLDPAAVQQAIGDGGGGGFFQPEVIVTDPACSGGTVSLGMGTVALDGCCDPTGVCGLSTANFPPFMGFQVPPMCLTNAETQGLIDAGADVSCSYRDSGGPPPTPGADSGSSGDGG